MGSQSKRREMDIMKLMMSDYQVEMGDDGTHFVVDFHGPENTYYQGGVWQVQVTLPKDYPYRSPSIGFKNRLFHPNVDEMSGSVCLDVINQTWSPMYDLVNIFDMFLPQLLSYPNASDPLNSEAASLMMQNPEKYKARVEDYVKRFASSSKMHTTVDQVQKTRHLSTDSDNSVISSSSYASNTTEPATASSSTASSINGSSTSDDNMEVSEDGPSDDYDDLSSLSDSSDTEDNLVLDL